jgi:hypothetical protein
LKVFLLRSGPEAGNPLPALVGASPIARHPLALGRRDAPGATDPEEILAIHVPAPVTRDPDDIAFRFLLRRFFGDGLGWLLGDLNAGFEVTFTRLSIGFVHRSAWFYRELIIRPLLSWRNLRCQPQSG